MSPQVYKEDIAATPFLLRLFHKEGGFCRPEELIGPALPPHTNLYTTINATLADVTLSLAVANPLALPRPAVGTRLVFSLVAPAAGSAPSPDTGSSSNGSPVPPLPRFEVRDLGSIIIGGYSGRGGDLQTCPPEDAEATAGPLSPATGEEDGDAPVKTRTLEQMRFVVGDLLTVAILPALENGSIAAASGAWTGSTTNKKRKRGGADLDVGPKRTRTSWPSETLADDFNIPDGRWHQPEGEQVLDSWTPVAGWELKWDMTKRVGRKMKK